MRRLVTAAQEPTWKFCDHCGRELVREVTVVSEPSGGDVAMFEPFKRPIEPYCIYQRVHEEGK